MPRLLAVLAGLAGLLPAAARGHAFGARYDLPLPLWLYLAAAGATVGLTFLMLVAAGGRIRDGGGYPHVELGPSPLSRCLRVGAGVLSVALLALVLVCGLAGVQSPTANFAPVFVWVIWWVGLGFVQALVGDVWAACNPWSAAYQVLEAGRRRCGRPLEARWRYPPRLGDWPAVALFLAFTWLELVSAWGERPATLAWLVIAYSCLTWLGMLAFGRETWLRHGEVFSVVFGLLARFAPLGPRPGGARARWELRPHAVGLLVDTPVPASLMVLVLCLLATVSFDGFLETSAWAGILEWVVAEPALRAPLLRAQELGADLLALVETIGLVAAPLLFLGVYAAASALAAFAAGEAAGPGRVARWFVLSLVPIAIAYHLAHYLSYLLLAGQLIIPRISDPLGLGWDLAGTAGYGVDIGVVSAKQVWYTAVAAIVTGHVLAVYLAHRTARRVFATPGAVLRSQLPMLGLMVGYTITSLWILSQPIVAV